MRVEDVLAHLEGVHGSTPQWTARCPAHEDRQASLTIAEGRDGRVLVTCWAGCSLESIVRAAGLEVRDLFMARELVAAGNGPVRAPWGKGPMGAPQPLPLQNELDKFALALADDSDLLALCWERKGWKRSTLSALGIGKVGDRLSIPVRDLGDNLVNHLRYRPDATPKMLAARGRPRVPLMLLLDAGPLFIVEGETDAISMAMIGLPSIGAPGASTKARPEWLAPVAGREVVVCFDSDVPGRRAALRWAKAAQEAGASSVVVLDLEGPQGFDVGELVREGREDPAAVRAGLLARAAKAPPFVMLEAAPEIPILEPADADVAQDAHKPGELISTMLDTIAVEPVRWLWQQRIPVGRVGILFGPPGHGKSTMTALLAADVTRAGGRVLIASAEDDPATTIRPRAQAAGADMQRMALLATKTVRGTTNLVLPRDLDALGRVMKDMALLIIDPLAAHLGDDVNAWSEQSVRAQVLAPLAWWARHTGCAVVLVMHINKSDKGDALARISGSGGFGGAARFALLLGLHPDDAGMDDELSQRLVLVHVKASEGRLRPAMVYRRQSVAFDFAGEPAPVPVLSLVDDQSKIEADSVLVSTDADERGAFTDAMTWLRRELSVGAQPSKRLLTQARERGDFSERTLRKAKRALGARSERESDGWYWVMEPGSGR